VKTKPALLYYLCKLSPKHTMPLSIGKMTVNVSLCGAIPRSTFSESAHALSEKSRGAPTPLSPKTIGSKTPPPPLSLLKAVSQSEDSQDTTMPQVSSFSSSRQQTIPVIEPPRWAVPAKRGARLEPVCEAVGTHVTVDLSIRSCFRIGRSPTSDVQLMHGTSSRRHALLFHHPNGHCYVVDCGSAHGTFVNGVRVRSTPSAGMVAPHRVKRGALIRFGGPGAPSFVLKSFSVGFSYMVKDLESPSCHPTLSPEASSHIPFRNPVRLNASEHPLVGGILKKRSFEDSTEERPSKRRCVSPISPETSPRLVSPDGRRVTFNDVPEAFYPSLVSPDLSSDDASL
jgi:hypothetical protein